MNKGITPDQLEEMIQAVIDAARATGLLAASGIDTLEKMIVSAHKRHARQQVRAALAARKQVALVNVRSKRAKFKD